MRFVKQFEQILLRLARVSSREGTDQNIRTEPQLCGKPREFRAVLDELEALHLSSTKTYGGTFWNQLFGGRSEAAVAGELFSVLGNHSMYTLKVGGNYVEIENAVIERLAKIIGFENFEGTFTPGGSLSNFLAFVLARDSVLSSASHEELRRMTVYSSEEAHYSVSKGLRLAGFNLQLFRKIESDSQGQLRVDLLERQIRKDKELGLRPTVFVGTAGTTVLGAFDSLEALSELAQREELWFHVDAAYGGPLIFHDRSKLKGIELADSVTWDAHKLMGVPLTASVLLCSHIGSLQASLQEEADYLFQEDIAVNPGARSLQCGRRNDALKVWAQWRHLGDAGFARRVESLLELAAYAKQKIARHPELELSAPSDFVNVCFNVRGVEPQTLCRDLDELGVKVSYGSFKNKYFVRLALVDPDHSEEELDQFFETCLAMAARRREFAA